MKKISLLSIYFFAAIAVATVTLNIPYAWDSVTANNQDHVRYVAANTPTIFPVGTTIIALFSDGTYQTFYKSSGTGTFRWTPSSPATDEEPKTCSNTDHIVSTESFNTPPILNTSSGCPDDGKTPILIDLGQDGFNMGTTGVGVSFDLGGSGKEGFFQWVDFNGNDAFLAIDLNGNSQIDNGRELFGEATQLILENGKNAINGYVALSQYDTQSLGGNNDDYISSDDEVWTKLLLWIDKDADGETDEGELLNIEESGISRLQLSAKRSKKVDSSGNLYSLWSWALNNNKKGNKKHRMVDITLNSISSNTIVNHN